MKEARKWIDTEKYHSFDEETSTYECEVPPGEKYQKQGMQTCCHYVQVQAGPGAFVMKGYNKHLHNSTDTKRKTTFTQDETMDDGEITPSQGNLVIDMYKTLKKTVANLIDTEMSNVSKILSSRKRGHVKQTPKTSTPKTKFCFLRVMLFC